MGDILKNATDWLNQTLKAEVSQSVTYARRNSSISVSATVGQTDAEKETETGVRFVFRSTDFLIVAADLVMDGETITPERGDRITWQGVTYEVTPLGNEPHYSTSGQYSTRWRIHTKRVSA